MATLWLASVATAAEPERGDWLPLSSDAWVLWLPDGLTPGPGEKIDLLVHFHGDPGTVFANAERTGLNAAVVAVNYPGLSSAYRRPFSDQVLFGLLLEDALVKLRERFGADAAWGTVAVSSFSAGYGAVRELLRVPEYADRIDAVLAADSLYASTAADGTPEDDQMAPYLAYARRAIAGEKTLILTHTDVPTPTYESTRETADELLAGLGLQAEPVDKRGLGPIRYTRHASAGRFTLWGAAGATGEDHMAHLRRLEEWLDDLPLARRASH